MREAILPVDHCQCFLPSPRGFLLTVSFLQVQDVPGQMFKGMLLSFTSDHHLAHSCSAGLHRRGRALRWNWHTGGSAWKAGTHPPFSSVLLPPCFLSFILCLHPSISQVDLSFFPFLLFGTLHLTWSGIFFLILITFCFLLYLPADPVMLVSPSALCLEETRIQDQKT